MRQHAEHAPTQGYAFDPEGRPLTDQPIVSGHKVASTAGLRRINGLPGWPWTLTDHVEAAVAARMREPGGPREVTLVLNNPPCARGRFGCDNILRDIIPTGSHLHVYVKDTSQVDGLRFHDTYVGTGRAIAP